MKEYEAYKARREAQINLYKAEARAKAALMSAHPTHFSGMFAEPEPTEAELKLDTIQHVYRNMKSMKDTGNMDGYIAQLSVLTDYLDALEENK